MVIGLKISEESRANFVILRLKGRLDAASSPHLDGKLNALIANQHRNILIDFSNVEYLSSAGMRLLLSATKKMKSLNGHLVLCCLNEEVLEIIKMAGFEKILSIFTTEQEAFEHHH
jgi:anti-sigma B factor antagonist/stage II sporulation protein AA (anti-sigma F factor antagonist)